MEIPSKLLQQAVDRLASLPGVGKRTALRFALHLLNESEPEVEQFVEAIRRMKTDIKHCAQCYSVSDTLICPICSNPKRQQSIICVVENIQDVMAIENTQQYNGLYHVLGGVISPIDGIGIHDLNIETLVQRVQREDSYIEEVILALPTTMEGDTTNYYIHKLLKPLDVKVTAIARGIAIGDNLEYADEVTLGRSILHRVPFS